MRRPLSPRQGPSTSQACAASGLCLLQFPTVAAHNTSPGISDLARQLNLSARLRWLGCRSPFQERPYQAGNKRQSPFRRQAPAPGRGNVRVSEGMRRGLSPAASACALFLLSGGRQVAPAQQCHPQQPEDDPQRRLQNVAAPQAQAPVCEANPITNPQPNENKIASETLTNAAN